MEIDRSQGALTFAA